MAGEVRHAQLQEVERVHARGAGGRPGRLALGAAVRGEEEHAVGAGVGGVVAMNGYVGHARGQAVWRGEERRSAVGQLVADVLAPAEEISSGGECQIVRSTAEHLRDCGQCGQCGQWSKVQGHVEVLGAALHDAVRAGGIHTARLGEEESMTVAERAGEDGLGEGDGVNADGVETNVAEEGRVAVDEQTQLLIDGEGLDLEGK